VETERFPEWVLVAASAAIGAFVSAVGVALNGILSRRHERRLLRITLGSSVYLRGLQYISAFRFRFEDLIRTGVGTYKERNDLVEEWDRLRDEIELVASRRVRKQLPKMHEAIREALRRAGKTGEGLGERDGRPQDALTPLETAWRDHVQPARLKLARAMWKDVRP
jgi:hypothetical protein